jgi:hypothetical protein
MTGTEVRSNWSTLKNRRSGARRIVKRVIGISPRWQVGKNDRNLPPPEVGTITKIVQLKPWIALIDRRLIFAARTPRPGDDKPQPSAQSCDITLAGLDAHVLDFPSHAF